jgi:hypothetical protein
MSAFLAENGLDQIRSQERYWALQIVDNLAEIERWRLTIDDAARRRHGPIQLCRSRLCGISQKDGFAYALIAPSAGTRASA